MANKKIELKQYDNEVQAWALTIGRTIAAMRNKRAMDQGGLADTAGLSRGTISHLERGSDGVSIGALLRCLLALQSDVWELLGGRPSGKPVRIEYQVLHDLLDEIAAKQNPQLTAAVREVLKSFATRS